MDKFFSQQFHAYNVEIEGTKVENIQLLWIYYTLQWYKWFFLKPILRGDGADENFWGLISIIVNFFWWNIESPNCRKMMPQCFSCIWIKFHKKNLKWVSPLMKLQKHLFLRSISQQADETANFIEKNVLRWNEKSIPTSEQYKLIMYNLSYVRHLNYTQQIADK